MIETGTTLFEVIDKQAFYTRYKSETIRLNSVDSQEGPKAFSEKREPDWQGR